MEQNRTAYSSTPPDASITTGKADLSKRFIAAVIDAVIAMVLGFIPIIGALLGAAYWLVRDGLTLEFMDGRSVGKKVMKLRPVRLDGGAMNIETSVRRNWMFGLGLLGAFFRVIPILGWILMILLALVALAIGLIELYLVITDSEGRRIGDKTGNTKVVETAT